MAEYIRARSGEHKEERLSEIKEAANMLFTAEPYHKITLTVIAEKLGWSRANLYKYVTTKEEIFLEITSDKMAAYYDALLASFPAGNKFSPEVIAEVWTGILNANQEYLRYVSYLTAIIETNVTVPRLAVFKKNYYEHANRVRDRLAQMLGISGQKSYDLTLKILLYSSSYTSSCYKNPLIQEALRTINVPPPKQDFYEDIKDFVLMSILWSVKNSR